MKNLVQYLEQSLQRDKMFPLALDAVKKVSIGKIWLIGSTVYRGIAEELHEIERIPRKDYDFLVEDMAKGYELPKEWVFETTFFGCPRIQIPSENQQIQIDIVPFKELFAHKKYGLPASLEGFFLQNPCSHQSIAYNIQNKRVVGDVGIASVINKTVGPCHTEELKACAKAKGISPKEYLQYKADKVGFDVSI